MKEEEEEEEEDLVHWNERNVLENYKRNPCIIKQFGWIDFKNAACRLPDFSYSGVSLPNLWIDQSSPLSFSQVQHHHIVPMWFENKMEQNTIRTI